MLSIILPFLYCAQLVYFKIYDSFFSFAAIGMAGQVTEAADQIWTVMVNNLGYLIIFWIPPILNLFFSKKIWNFEKNTLPHQLTLISVVLLFQGITLGLLQLDKNGVFSDYQLYTQVTSSIQSVERFGMLTTMKIEVEKNFLSTESSNIFLTNSPNSNYQENNEIKYNQIDIDWETIIKEETDEETKQIHQYLSSLTPTEKNSYTGMFEGKNVIFILAESLYAPAISEELTPTLYKMAQEGFQFKNYYVPLYPSSTADGEYMLEFGLLPVIGNTYNLIDSSTNYNPYSFVNTFEPLDYKVSAYHGYTSSFYNRNKYFKNMGYKEYGFCDTSLNITCYNMHASDLEMVKNSIDNYIHEESFFTYYISISGHGSYDYNNNFVARKNWKAVKDLDYSNYLKGYLAGNIELDKALEYLMSELEKADKLEDTVFVISPDHWPYYFKTRIKELEPIAGDSIYDKFKLHKNSLIIYNSSMKEPIPVEKVTTNIDVLPTLLNLMGIDFDSRLLVGTDALSNSNGLVVFSDYSWITDLGTYDGKKFTATNQETMIPEQYVEGINIITKQKLTVSSFIQKNNYYKTLFDKINSLQKTEEKQEEIEGEQ